MGLWIPVSIFACSRHAPEHCCHLQVLKHLLASFWICRNNYACKHSKRYVKVVMVWAVARWKTSYRNLSNKKGETMSSEDGLDLNMIKK